MRLVADGNLVWRYLGIPKVTVPMGRMTHTSMSVKLTFAGKYYDSVFLLRLGATYEALGKHSDDLPQTARL